MKTKTHRFLKTLCWLLAGLSLTPASAGAAFHAQVNIDVSEFKNPQELMHKISELTIGIAIDGSTGKGRDVYCEFRSLIQETRFHKDRTEIHIAFDYKGDAELCGDGSDGVMAVWKSLSQVRKIKLGPLQRD